MIDKPTVLVVDDSELIRHVLAAKLENSGFSVYGASTGEDAIYIARAASPDFIVLDLRLPGMPGTAVFDVLRSDPKTCAIPVVVYSGFASQYTKDRFCLEAAGFVDKTVDGYVKVVEILNEYRLKLAREAGNGSSAA